MHNEICMDTPRGAFEKNYFKGSEVCWNVHEWILSLLERKESLAGCISSAVWIHNEAQLGESDMTDNGDGCPEWSDHGANNTQQTALCQNDTLNSYKTLFCCYITSCLWFASCLWFTVSKLYQGSLANEPRPTFSGGPGRTSPSSPSPHSSSTPPARSSLSGRRTSLNCYDSLALLFILSA